MAEPYLDSRMGKPKVLMVIQLWFLGESDRMISNQVGVNKDTVTRTLQMASVTENSVVVVNDMVAEGLITAGEKDDYLNELAVWGAAYRQKKRQAD